MSWFYSFKLHLLVSEQGELLAVRLTLDNIDDHKPIAATTKNLFGKLLGIRAISRRHSLKSYYERGLNLSPRYAKTKNMKGQLMLLSDRLLLRKHVIIETIIDRLENIFQIKHTRHRSPANFAVNLLAGLIAYKHQPKKLSVCLIGQINQLPTPI